MKILFICTGNTCRSPMAELYFNHYRKLNGKSPCASSCGVATSDNRPISVNAAKVMELLGIDASLFRSTIATGDILAAADKIFVMSAKHQRVIERCFPEFSGRTSLLLDGRDVADPYGMGFDTYMATFNMMKEKIELLADTLP